MPGAKKPRTPDNCHNGVDDPPRHSARDGHKIAQTTRAGPPPPRPPGSGSTQQRSSLTGLAWEFLRTEACPWGHASPFPPESGVGHDSIHKLHWGPPPGNNFAEEARRPIIGTEFRANIPSPGGSSGSSLYVLTSKASLTRRFLRSILGILPPFSSLSPVRFHTYTAYFW